jgi:predicted metal-dependent phosphoesterase TrpH
MNSIRRKELVAAELHCHTVYSLDSSNHIDALIQAACEKGIQRLAITDHNSIKGALRAWEIAPNLVIVGEEVLTERGELIAYYVKEEVPGGLSVEETLKRFRDQGAFISIPHPFDLLRHGWRHKELMDLLPEVDALEVFNARCLCKTQNDRAHALAQEHSMLMTAGSDAHSLVELGLAMVELPNFSNAAELRESLKDARIRGRMLSPMDHFRASAQIGLSKIFSIKRDK